MNISSNTLCYYIIHFEKKKKKKDKIEMNHLREALLFASNKTWKTQRTSIGGRSSVEVKWIGQASHPTSQAKRDKRKRDSHYFEINYLSTYTTGVLLFFFLGLYSTYFSFLFFFFFSPPLSKGFVSFFLSFEKLKFASAKSVWQITKTRSGKSTTESGYQPKEAYEDWSM